MQKESRVKSVSLLYLAVIIAEIILAVILSFRIQGKAYYYTMAVVIAVLSLLPFFISFERRMPSARELSSLAVMTAIAVASRAIMYAFPAVKPMCAIVIITAVGFGPFAGFICGAAAAFISNFIFGQGMWTPFQMLGLGTVGLLAGLILKNRKLAQNRIFTAVTGALLAFAVYGAIVDISTVLMVSSQFSVKNIISVYSSGAVYSLIHALTTAAVLFVAGKTLIEKLTRMSVKYNIWNYGE